MAGTGSSELSRVNSLAQQQSALLSGASTLQAYESALSYYVEAKHTQAERITDRLERSIAAKEQDLRKHSARRPGFLSGRRKRHEWQQQQARRQARLRKLSKRLARVQNIANGMGLHSPRIQMLATRRLRARNPELVADWRAVREEERLEHLAHGRGAAARDRQQTRGGRSLTRRRRDD